ncbi:yippee family protein [Niveomyces insectorum RCEF 264]|uniref:Yippee family protein n=1 Tax=Niveomyces insectorum RCEF 264 TaxID=1081102 RepID=A0A167Y648_9HYPO|nr:yippee family protein [Niveomyces insectorum RCEF 264]
MFGRNRSADYQRPFASFLLPSLPNLFRARKTSVSSAPRSPRNSIAGSRCSASVSALAAAAPGNNSGDDHANSHGSASQRSSCRYSVASASSAVSGTSSQIPPSLCMSTSPSSYGSYESGDQGSSTAFNGRGYVPGVVGPHDLRTSSPPWFAATLTAEPELDHPDDPGMLASRSRTWPAWGLKYNQQHNGRRSLPPLPSKLNQNNPHHHSRRRRHLTRVQPDTLRCGKCAADLAFSAQIVSKGFTGRHGRAYLVSAPATAADHLYAPEVPAGKDRARKHHNKGVDDDDEDGEDEHNLANIRVGRPEHRQLVTGAHVVADISCALCGSKLGWKYVDARDAAQRYKVGKFILEIARLSTFHSWEDEEAQEDDEIDDGGYGDDERMYHADEHAYAYDRHCCDGVEYGAVADTVGTVRSMMAKRTLSSPLSETSGGAEGDNRAPAAIEFDSDDEDECEDIFAGTWDAEVVAKRRSEKRSVLAAA